jgi:hypothetical protein
MALNLALDKDDAFGDLLVEVEKHRVHRRLLGERAQPFDRLAARLASRMMRSIALRTSPTKPGDLGIGPSICRSIILAHGARV